MSSKRSPKYQGRDVAPPIFVKTTAAENEDLEKICNYLGLDKSSTVRYLIQRAIKEIDKSVEDQEPLVQETNLLEGDKAKSSIPDEEKLAAVIRKVMREELQAEGAGPKSGKKKAG